MIKKKRIACLPVAGKENPYQLLMIKGLNKSDRVYAFNGIDNRFFGIIKTWFKQKPDYIHFDWIHSYYTRRNTWMTYMLLPIFCFQILFIRFLSKTKMVWTLHNIMPHNSNNFLLNKYIRTFFAKQCVRIRVFSDNTVLKASKLFNVKQNKFKVVPEGDYTNFYKNEISRIDARRIFKYKETDRVILYIGFVRPYKGLDNLITTFKKIKDENLRLVIIGKARDLNYFSKLTKLIDNCDNKDRILLEDRFLKDDELQIYYNASDVVVLPFDKVENSGSAIMAMGFGKPIIAPKMGVLLDRLAQQENLLYDDLFDKLNHVSKMTQKELTKIGLLNKQSLDKYKWSNFYTFFENE